MVGAPRMCTLNVAFLVDGWRSWTNFSSGGTKGYFIYHYPSLQGGDGLFFYFDWFSKTLTRFLSLCQNSKFMHRELTTRGRKLSGERRKKLPLISHQDFQRKAQVEDSASQFTPPLVDIGRLRWILLRWTLPLTSVLAASPRDFNLGIGVVTASQPSGGFSTVGHAAIGVSHGVVATPAMTSYRHECSFPPIYKFALCSW